MYSGDICLWPVYGWLCVSVRSEEGAEGSSAADSSAVSNKPPLQSASEQLFKHFHTVDDKTIEAADHHDHHFVVFLKCTQLFLHIFVIPNISGSLHRLSQCPRNSTTHLKD